MKYAEKMLQLFSEDMPECNIDYGETYWWKKPEVTLLESMIGRMDNKLETTLNKLVDDSHLFRNMRSRSKDAWIELCNQAVEAGYRIHQRENKYWYITKLA